VSEVQEDSILARGGGDSVGRLAAINFVRSLTSNYGRFLIATVYISTSVHTSVHLYMYARPEQA